MKLRRKLCDIPRSRRPAPARGARARPAVRRRADREPRSGDRAPLYDTLFAAFPEACIVSSVRRLNLLGRFDDVPVMDRGRLLDHGSVAERAAQQRAAAS
ncbi:MAG: hypothetical protein NVS9B10_23550 [Nevskia sp.]